MKKKSHASNRSFDSLSSVAKLGLLIGGITLILLGGILLPDGLIRLKERQLRSQKGEIGMEAVSPYGEDYLRVRREVEKAIDNLSRYMTGEEISVEEVYLEETEAAPYLEAARSVWETEGIETKDLSSYPVLHLQEADGDGSFVIGIEGEIGAVILSESGIPVMGVSYAPFLQDEMYPEDEFEAIWSKFLPMMGDRLMTEMIELSPEAIDYSPEYEALYSEMIWNRGVISIRQALTLDGSFRLTMILGAEEGYLPQGSDAEEVWTEYYTISFLLTKE